MDGTQCCMRISGELSSSFESRRSLLQGYGLSCMTFNVALEGVIRRAVGEMRGAIFNRSSQLISFTNDIDIVGRSSAAVEEIYRKLKREAGRIGLMTNTSKTKYMLACGSETDRTRLSSNNKVTIDGDELEIVEDFVYLGSLVTADNETSREIRRRIISGSHGYYGLHKQLRSRRLSPRTKCNLYMTLIRPVVLYGHETWILL
ncbi:uncharacterized protein LOC129749279 [Uranotaenia lowii]|uniref:uncharacterized protein LOC129749279 n=1 Tax=Uranotaenia lowii TaxID=190385 RepID=UPI002478BD1E|nr:uncharacterized protein LOC129749279 [Uranotaenia lowii]